MMIFILLALGLAQVIGLYLESFFLTWLPIPSRWFVVITMEVSASISRHGMQCRSSGPLPTPTVAKLATTHIRGLTPFLLLVVFTYCREVMMKNEHAFVGSSTLPFNICSTLCFFAIFHGKLAATSLFLSFLRAG